MLNERRQSSDSLSVWRIVVDAPRAPQISPLSCEMLSTRWKNSMAWFAVSVARKIKGQLSAKVAEVKEGRPTFPKSSFARAMPATWVSALMLAGLWRRACSYAACARSRSDSCSATAPVEVEGWVGGVSVWFCQLRRMAERLSLNALDPIVLCLDHTPPAWPALPTLLSDLKSRPDRFSGDVVPSVVPDAPYEPAALEAPDHGPTKTSTGKTDAPIRSHVCSLACARAWTAVICCGC